MFPYILHGFSKDSIIYKLEKIFLKIVWSFYC